MKRVLFILPWLGALLLIAIALLCFETDLLWKIQQYNLFLDTSLYFRDMMLVPGGLLSYVGCYFTEFFFHPWLGVLILCGCWLLMMWLTKRVFHISDNWAVIALIPVTILLVANMNLGYWHYFMKLRGYFFIPTIGTTAAVAMLWVFRALPQKSWLRIVFILMATTVGYPFLGVYALAAVLLMAIWTWRLSNNHSWNLILTAVALICIVGVPLLYYRYVYYQTYFGDIWTMALPSFIVVESFPLNYIPYYLLGAFFLLLVVFYQKTLMSFTSQKSLLKWSPQIGLVVVLSASVCFFWYKDENFHHELTMQHCIENTDWEGVLHEGQNQEEEPTRAIVMMYNLALSRLGCQLDEMYNFPRGNMRPNTPLPVSILYHVFGRMIYYQYGLLNDCHRLCMEDGVEYGWRVELQEYIARCSLLSGETQAAQKVLNLLHHTRYHEKWADAMQQLLDHPEQISKARETGPITHMLHYENALGSDGGNVEEYVMSLLARLDSNDSYFQEQAVLASLWMRSPRQFWARFVQYTRLHPRGPIPRIFQEAAYLFGKEANRPNLDKLPFDKSVKETYYAFMKEAKQYDNRAVELGRVALHPFFGNTYYYEYYFMKNNH